MQNILERIIELQDELFPRQSLQERTVNFSEFYRDYGKNLIPQLIGAVKGYMDHESGVLTRITEARSKAMGAKSINDKVSAENELGAAMGAFNIQVEAYPDLKASTNFLQLQNEISDIENKLAAVRRFFNSATKELNTAIESIPTNIVANIKKMTPQPMFDLGETQREQLDKAPEVKF